MNPKAKDRCKNWPSQHLGKIDFLILLITDSNFQGKLKKGLDLPRVKTDDGNPGEIDFGSSKREVQVNKGSSYRV